MYPQTHQSPGVCDDDSPVIFDIVRVLISNMQHCVKEMKKNTPLDEQLFTHIN